MMHVPASLPGSPQARLLPQPLSLQKDSPPALWALHPAFRPPQPRSNQLGSSHPQPTFSIPS